MINQLPRIIVKGGVLSPAELKLICESAISLGMKAISFGHRQDILFPENISDDTIDTIGNCDVIHPNKQQFANISSSYLCADIFPRTPWLTSDKYLYILEDFRRNYVLKINITDPKQRLVPLFHGHLNFIASEQEDFWYLYIKLPNWKEAEPYPVLIYSLDIVKIVDAIDGMLQEEPYNVNMIFDLVNDDVETNSITIDKPLHIPFYPFPYYEGMNRIGQDKYWLGLYWRKNNYYLDFLIELCNLCSECKIGKISITPWKSFIVKDIPASTKLIWEKFLGKYGINVRHSLLELNWHLPVANIHALELKTYLVGEFDKNDISTYGLTFGIVDVRKTSHYFASIIIECNRAPEGLTSHEIPATYNLHYAKDFDPNTREYIIHAQEVDKSILPKLLMELSKLYFEQLGTEKDIINVIGEEEEKETSIEVHQCKDCLTVYDDQYGDESQNITPGTTFAELSDQYKCSLCDAPKSNFTSKIIVQTIS